MKKIVILSLLLALSMLLCSCEYIFPSTPPAQNGEQNETPDNEKAPENTPEGGENKTPENDDNDIEQGGDNPEQGGNNPEQGGGNPEQGGDNPEQGGDNPEQGGDNRGSLRAWKTVRDGTVGA